MTIRVVIADDHPVVRSGYRRLLSLERDMEVLAECGSGEEACDWLAQHTADVLILDLSMPGRGGLDTLRRLQARLPGLAVLVFSMHDNPALVRQALALGATGYVSKRSAPEELSLAIRQVARGQRHVSAELAEAVSPPAPHLQLSQREFMLFLQLAQGLTAKQLADDFHLSPKTVYNHQTQIYRKLAVDNAAQLTRYAIEHGLLAQPVEPDPAPR